MPAVFLFNIFTVKNTNTTRNTNNFMIKYMYVGFLNYNYEKKKPKVPTKKLKNLHFS